MEKHIPESEIVACNICLKEIPISEATSPESVDYVAHFCSLECYDKWKDQKEQAGGNKPE